MSVIYTGRTETSPKARPALLPLLVVLFIASYTILTMLVVEQGRTIEAQRGLLREMLKDSNQLAELKGKLARESDPLPNPKNSERVRQDDKQRAQMHSPFAPKAPTHSHPQARTKARDSREVPARPAEDLQDVRRSTRVT